MKSQCFIRLGLFSSALLSCVAMASSGPQIEQPIERPKPEHPIEIPRPEQPIERPGRPNRPGGRPYPPVVVYPPSINLPVDWQGSTITFYQVAKEQAPLPGELTNIEVAADDRAKLMIIDAKQEVVFDGWLGMGDLRQWQVRHPVQLFFSELNEIELTVAGEAIDLSGYPQDSAVSLRFGEAEGQ
ncbi:RodZ domain-containing protein [Aliagarivorans marinus]|uniref:RodZ domain-containing protein n=1 Tax=Aliagarivorans marinus TaxID=561965 RepID=UPI00041919C6|nr:RodZ domain-containing protein [Aliagarivorans marinus]